MNIFFLDTNAHKAAAFMVDRHVVKMPLESVQMLSTAHRLLDGVEYNGTSKTGRKVKRWRLMDEREDILYSATHVNHPSAVWCRTSVENYLWLVEHNYALLDEYKYRYGKTHACSKLMYHLQSPPHNLRLYDFTRPALAMPDEYKVNDPVESYRNYYRVGKLHLHAWKNRQQPDWI